MVQLGKLYRTGLGVLQNFDLAVDWMRKAAASGDAEGMMELGRLYRTGTGVKQDLIQAYVWFNRAAAALHNEALNERENVALRLSPAELKEAQVRSAADEAGKLAENVAPASASKENVVKR
jgi:TPR repeat protein